MTGMMFQGMDARINAKLKQVSYVQEVSQQSQIVPLNVETEGSCQAMRIVMTESLVC